MKLTILLITTPRDLPAFQGLLGDGEELGINLKYAVQPSPDGIAQAFIIGESFIGNSPVSLILGDNFFYGQSLTKILKKIASTQEARENKKIRKLKAVSKMRKNIPVALIIRREFLD